MHALVAPRPWPGHATRQQARCHASRKQPVVILPGFLQDCSQYVDVAKQLESLGHPTVVAQIKAVDWLPTLAGAHFGFALECAQQAIKSACAASDGKHVALVGHSAGGWLARLLLGRAPYLGKCWHVTPSVDRLITLGTPHLSLEAYPFGRVQEQRPGEPADLPDDVKGSSLRFANYFYTTAQSLPGVTVVCVAGTGIPGSRSLTSTPKTDLPVTSLDAWLAGGSYASNCGDAEVVGDGVTPTCCALLPGAQSLLLPGVWHAPNHQPWYGSPEIVDVWAQSLITKPEQD